MKKTGLIPVFILESDTDKELLMCLCKNNDGVSISNTILEGTAVETAIKYSKLNLGYIHNPEYNLKKIVSTDNDTAFFVIVDEMFTPSKNAIWIKTSDAEKNLFGYLHEDFQNIIDKINKYTFNIKSNSNTDFISVCENID